MTTTVSAAARFRVAAERLRGQIGYWTAPRYAAAAASGASRAEVLRALVQRLADLAADAEGQPRRTVPPADPDTAILDQIRVLAADLLAANPSDAALDTAATAITATAHTLD